MLKLLSIILRKGYRSGNNLTMVWQRTTNGLAKKLDNAVWGMVKKALRFPWRTVISFFYVPWRQGGLGLPNVENDLDVRLASQVYKYLTSKDPKVVITCARCLKDTLVARKAVKDASILKRILKAIPSDLGDIYLEQEIPRDPEKNCPNLVINNRSKKKAIVVDITIPFEGEEDSLQAYRTTKETKYSGLKAWL